MNRALIGLAWSSPGSPEAVPCSLDENNWMDMVIVTITSRRSRLAEKRVLWCSSTEPRLQELSISADMEKEYELLLFNLWSWTTLDLLTPCLLWDPFMVEPNARLSLW